MTVTATGRSSGTRLGSGKTDSNGVATLSLPGGLSELQPLTGEHVVSCKAILRPLDQIIGGTRCWADSRQAPINHPG